MAGFADTDEGREACKLALMELAEAFGASDIALDALMPVAMAGRLYLKDGNAVYVLGAPLKLANGEDLKIISLREPEASDYLAYSGGMSVKVSRDGSSEIDAVMMFRRTMKAVSALGDQPIGIVDRIKPRDIRTLGEVCDALGFFE